MSQAPKELTFEEASDIPEFAALPNDRIRKFTLEYAQNGCNAPRAAAAADYPTTYGAALIARPDVGLALQALAKSLFHVGVLLAFYTARRIMEDPTQSAGDQLKAAVIVLDRGGMPASSNLNVKVERVLNEAETMAKAIEIAREMGLDPATLIGRNTPIPLIAEDPLAGVDDL